MTFKQPLTTGLFAFALAFGLCACAPTQVEEPDEPEVVASEWEEGPSTPYTADEIKAAARKNTSYLYKTTSPDGEQGHYKLLFAEVSETGIRLTEEHLDGSLITVGNPTTEWSTYAELRHDDLFPAEYTRRKSTTIDVLGRKGIPCWQYEVGYQNPDEMQVFYFAKSAAYAGPPLKMEMHMGENVMTMEVIELLLGS